MDELGSGRSEVFANRVRSMQRMFVLKSKRSLQLTGLSDGNEALGQALFDEEEGLIEVVWQTKEGERSIQIILKVVCEFDDASEWILRGATFVLLVDIDRSVEGHQDLVFASIRFDEDLR